MDKVLENTNRIALENAELKREIRMKNTQLENWKTETHMILAENFPLKTYNIVLLKEYVIADNFKHENFNAKYIQRCPNCGCSVVRVYGIIVPVDDEAQYIAELKKHNPEGITVSNSNGTQDPKDIKLDPEHLRNAMDWDLICAVCNTRFMLEDSMTIEEEYPYGLTGNHQTSEIAQE